MRSKNHIVQDGENAEEATQKEADACHGRGRRCVLHPSRKGKSKIYHQNVKLQNFVYGLLEKMFEYHI